MATHSGLSQTVIQGMTMAGLNLIKQALSIYDSELRLVVANERFREMFEIPDHLMRPGASFEETIRVIATRGEYGAVDDIEHLVKERVDRALAFEPHYMEREREDGRWISVEGSPLPQGGWVTVYTDITSVKRQEDLLRTRSEELSEKLLKYSEDLATTNRQLESTVIALEEAKRQVSESEARMRLTTEMMPAHIAHVGPDWRYTYSNRRLSSVMPGRPRNIVGTFIGETLGESAFARLKPQLEQAFEGTPTVFEFTDQDSQHRIRVALTPDSEPRASRGVYILSMDVTQESQTRAVLQQTRRRELAAQMTSGLAHDFSNLLTIILGSQSKLEKLSLPSPASDLVEATLTAARRGGTLLDRLADMTGQRAPKLEAVLMPELLEQIQTLAGPALGEDADLEIVADVPDRPMLMDAGVLQDSLLNLILNARDAMEGKGTIRLSVTLVQDTWVRLEVRDSGPGFTDIALQKALDPFFTTKGSEGSGLGLPMVYDAVKLMGGDVKLNNLSVGASVAIRLPLRWARQTETPGLVLLVEDNLKLRDMIRDMLTALGHTVIETGATDEAKTLIDSLPDISMVLSDIKLEGSETGVDLARNLPRDIPIYLMTSLPETDPLYISGAALAPVLRKPFAQDALAKFLSPEGAV